jgi:hypothetical protein
MPISSCPFVRLKNFWQQLMNIMKSLFQNIRPSLEKSFANTRIKKVLNILPMDFAKNATIR